MKGWGRGPAALATAVGPCLPLTGRCQAPGGCGRARQLFNGDFVDRGSFSLEGVLTMIGFKVLYPDHFHITRGNHETNDMNKIYGFEGEVKHK